MAIDPSTNAAAQRFPLIESLLRYLGLFRKPITPVDHQPSAADPESLAPGQTESTENQATAEDEEQSPEQEALGLVDMLAPGGVCLTIFNSVLQTKAAAEGRRELPLFEPLVSFVVMGFFSSFAGFFYALFKKKEGNGLRQRAEVERVKFKWLMAGWLFTVIAVALWILLPLTEDSLRKVSLGVVAGSVPLVLFFWALWVKQRTP